MSEFDDILAADEEPEDDALSMGDLSDEAFSDILDRPSDEVLQGRAAQIEQRAREKALQEARARSDEMRARYRGEGSSEEGNPYDQAIAGWESTKMAGLSNADFEAFLRMRTEGANALDGRLTSDEDLLTLYGAVSPPPVSEDE